MRLFGGDRRVHLCAEPTLERRPKPRRRRVLSAEARYGQFKTKARRLAHRKARVERRAAEAGGYSWAQRFKTWWEGLVAAEAAEGVQ